MTKEKNNTGLFVILALIIFVLLILNFGGSISILSAIAVLTVSFILTFSLKDSICNFGFSIKENKLSAKQQFLMTTFVCLLPLTLSFLAYYPGGMNLDAYGQWWQVQDEFLNDWHPAMNTILIYLITRIWNSFPFYIYVQILAFCLSIGYLSSALNKVGIPHILNMVWVLYVALSPATLTIMTSMLKDSSFAIFTVLLFAQIVLIYNSEGEWLESKKNILAFVLTLVMATLMRHNGMFFTIPVLALLFLYKKHIKKIITISILFISVVCIIKGPVYSSLHVVKHENTVGEAVGIPMAILGNELVNSPETIDEETHKFLNTIASDEEWKDHYYTGEWDSVKWDFGGTELLRDVKLTTIISYTLKSVYRSPKCAFDSFSKNTQVITILLGRAYWAEEPYVSDNTYGIVFNGVPVLNSIMHYYVSFTSQPFISTLFWCLGILMLALAVLFIRALANHDFNKLIFVLPLLIYDAGTAMLLSGPSFRYFYFNIPIGLAAILLLLAKSNKEIKTN